MALRLVAFFLLQFLIKLDASNIAEDMTMWFEGASCPTNWVEVEEGFAVLSKVGTVGNSGGGAFSVIVI